VIRGGVVVVGEVASLKVEDALALVITDERLITIVAQPLSAALQGRDTLVLHAHAHFTPVSTSQSDELIENLADSFHTKIIF
jgi:hypothetical protein